MSDTKRYLFHRLMNTMPLKAAQIYTHFDASATKAIHWIYPLAEQRGLSTQSVESSLLVLTLTGIIVCIQEHHPTSECNALV